MEISEKALLSRVENNRSKQEKTDYNAIIFHGFLDRLRLLPMFERCVEQVRPLKVESITEKIAHTGG